MLSHTFAGSHGRPIKGLCTGKREEDNEGLAWGSILANSRKFESVQKFEQLKQYTLELYLFAQFHNLHTCINRKSIIRAQVFPEMRYDLPNWS